MTQQNQTITLLGQPYLLLVDDPYDSIAIPDCFVLGNKLDGNHGHGEAKLYIGSRRSDRIHSFFSREPMVGMILKRDLLDYLEDAKYEYEYMEQKYRKDISSNWNRNRNVINQGEDILRFEFRESDAGGPARYYIESTRGDAFYSILRRVVLPEITYLSIMKLKSPFGETVYYFRPYLNYFYDSRHHSIIISEKEKDVAKDPQTNESEKTEIINARKGQGKYRNEIIDEWGECIFTRVNDERMLIASHIKPWAVCDTDEERVDRYNGLLLTPTYDRLFDQGFISFEDDGTLLVSPYLSPLNQRKLALIQGKRYELPINNRRCAYLLYHRNNVFKKPS